MHRLEPTDALVDALGPYLDAERDAGAGAWVLANMVGTLAGSAATGGKVGSLSDVEHLEPGHEADERPGDRPPTEPGVQ